MSRWTPRKKFSASTFRRISAAAFLALGLGLGSACANADTRSADPYYILMYDFEVASFCGLIGPTLLEAYRTKRAALETGAQKATAALTRTRIRAMADADLEYQNRGLGGYKPWCANEGMAGVARILE